MGAEQEIRSASIARWRSDFPVLKTEMNGRPLAYLDTAASAQKPYAVIDEMNRILNVEYSNIHRGLYEISQNLTQEFEGVRTRVAGFLNAQSERSIVFTRNTTEAINLVAQSWGCTFLEEGDEIILSVMEHHANIVPWQLLREQRGILIRTILVDEQGVLDLESLQNILSEKTRLVSVVQVSNALGTVNDINKIIEITKEFNPDIKVLVDGSQSVVHTPVDVQALDCDFFAFTGHKLYAPTGVGVLYGREELLNAMPPYQGGGDMIESVTFEKTTYKEAPHKFEAGTPAIVEVIGLGAAIDYLQAIGMEAVAAHEQELLAYGTKALREIDGIRLYGTGPDKGPILSFTAEWAGASDIGMILDQCGVAVRTGHHCCMPLMQRYGIDATVRASMGLYSSMGDIDRLIEGLKKAKDMLS